jgi:hypothetical protein
MKDNMTEIVQGVMVISEIKRSSPGGYSAVVYWHTDTFMDEPPYRRIVKWILEELRKRYRVEIIAEPEESKGEDFVFHHLEVDGRRMQIYWENSLGYISFISADRNLIQELSSYLNGQKPAYENV